MGLGYYAADAVRISSPKPIGMRLEQFVQWLSNKLREDHCKDMEDVLLRSGEVPTKAGCVADLVSLVLDRWVGAGATCIRGTCA